MQAGQARTSEHGDLYYDVWASFSATNPETGPAKHDRAPATDDEKELESRVAVRQYTVTTEVQPPKRIHANARVQFEVRVVGARILLFELSRFLQVESVKLDGQPVEFIHNPAVEGNQFWRRGNDLVAVVLPEPTRAGQKIDLDFV